MRVVNLQKLAELQRNPKNIRNLCIMAHVDHGKTTLADSVVASNGIISKRMVGKLRYMDSRKDEQERGITMKSSSISLYCIHKAEDFLVNLIDSPGHVDFSSEVSTAVRLCDGAIIVVDAVEGVCAQTKVVLRQAWFESIRPVLVLNKIDRLIVEMKFQPLDAYIHISQVLEQVNAYVGELFAAEVLSKASMKAEWHIDEEDDSHIYFSPAQGNVVFASAVDGWGFTIQHFARMFAPKLGVSETVLNNSLWGDFYYSPKTKSILEGAQMKAKKPLFVQIVLENLWSVYDSVVIRKDKLMVEKIVKSLNLQIPPRELAHTDVKIQLQAVMGQWLPLSNSILGMVCEKLPSPLEVSESRAESLVTSQSGSFTDLPDSTKYLQKSFMACSSSEDQPVVAFISKMVPVERRSLPQNKARPLTAEDIARRREMIRKKLAEQQLSDKPAEPREEVKDEQNEEAKSEDKKEDELEEVFIAFARVFSGTLRKGQQLYVLGPKYDPNTMADVSVDPEATLKDLKPGQHVTRATIGDLYLLMGREMEQLEEVPAGNVIGIGGLDEHVLKSATLSSTLHCPAFSEITQMAVPIVRVAVEPSRPADMPALVRGLKLLNQADPCVQVLLQETGEHVIVTAGEVHLQRCLQDLRERYAKVEISASQPIVPFRETVVPRSSGTEAEPSAKKTEDEGLIDIQTPNKRCAMKIRAVPLPAEVIEFLERNSVSIKALAREETSETATIDVSTPLAKKASNVGASELKAELENVLDKCSSPWKGIADSIWSFGPRRCGPNLLINRSAVKLPNVWQSRADCDSTMLDIHNSFVNGFQLATLSGPLCEEPLMGVAFFVEDWNIVTGDSETNANQPYGPFSGQIMSTVKEGCRRAFQAQPQRLMAAMYTCTIQVSAEVLGKMYGVISRRHGRVLAGDLDEGTATFSVTAVLPVVESFDLANEIRKQTSGQASPQLVFSHWEVIDTDPFWTPSTEEELELYGDKGDSINRAQVYMNSVRRRKGLPVLEKVVEFAEKQRTLSRKV